MVWNRKVVSARELETRLKELSGIFPDYAIILRGDRSTKYENIMAVLDVCRAANIWNVAFAAGKVE